MDDQMMLFVELDEKLQLDRHCSAKTRTGDRDVIFGIGCNLTWVGGLEIVTDHVSRDECYDERVERRTTT